MELASTLMFASAVRALGHATRRSGLTMPAFRSPPRVEGVDRTLRHRVGGGVTVAVRLRGRPSAAVLADMIEGIVQANSLSGVSADHARSALWQEAGPLVSHAPVDTAA
ncbi:MAG: hypothetical protein AB7V43_13225 [Acidimicrobiia bacterium]